MLSSLGAASAGLQLADAARAGACTLLGVLPRLFAASHQLAADAGAATAFSSRRPLAALAATGYPSPDAPSFQYAVLEAPLLKEQGAPVPGAIPRRLLPFAQRMASLGGRRAAGTEAVYEAAVSAAQAGQPFAIVLGTGGTEGAALKLAAHYHKEYQKAQQAAAGELPHEPLGWVAPTALPPLVLVAHPYSNSLPSALEALAALQQEGLRGRAVYLASAAAGSPQGEAGWAALRGALQSVRVWHQLHRSRIGLVGPPSEWLVASVPPSQLVTAAWGPSLVDVDMQELMGALWGGGRFKKAEVDAAVADLLSSSGAPPTHTHSPDEPASDGCPACGAAAAPGPADPESAAKVYLAMRRLVDKHGLSCITVRCFDIVTAQQTSGCYSLSRLLDENIIAGCEGDVCSALGMLWGKLMTGQVPWMANTAQVDMIDGVLKLAHCTIARSLLASHEATAHFESGLGVALKGEVPPGAVTLLRIGGRDLDQLWVEEGYALRQGKPKAGDAWSPQLCRTQVRVSLLGGRSAVEALLKRPLGNHVVLLRGHHKAALQSYFRLCVPGAEH
ncbi:hypothetical protein ABPG75_007529 [Micractinium tetrahymenae]